MEPLNAILLHYIPFGSLPCVPLVPFHEFNSFFQVFIDFLLSSSSWFPSQSSLPGVPFSLSRFLQIFGRMKWNSASVILSEFFQENAKITKMNLNEAASIMLSKMFQENAKNTNSLRISQHGAYPEQHHVIEDVLTFPKMFIIWGWRGTYSNCNRTQVATGA